MKQIALIAHNIRSTYNVGSLFRTADGLGVDSIYLTGYTPYPKNDSDPRLPHLANKIDRQISKVALGAEKTVSWNYRDDIIAAIQQLRLEDYSIVALEQSPKALSLKKYVGPAKIALIVGDEVRGLNPTILDMCDAIVEIPMFGKKESFNVAVAAGIGLSHLTL